LKIFKTKRANKDKRLVVVSDMHCGHNCGLTPPLWQFKLINENPELKRNQYGAIQLELWQWYMSTMRDIKSEADVDILLLNGDCIDGKGQAAGGTELITVDRNEQVEMANHCIKQWDAKDIVMTYGTSYHTGKDEDFEETICKDVGALSIKGEQFFEINGKTFNAKHKIGSSGIPHGRFTAIAKSALWNRLWADAELSPKADVLIRSHVHFYVEVRNRDMYGIITPAMQAIGSKFGNRQCEGLIDVGLVVIDISKKGNILVTPRLAKLKSHKAVSIKL